MDRITIASVAQFVDIIRRNPAVANIPSFNGLKAALSVPEPSMKGCKCKTKNNLAKFRPQFEASMSVLSTKEQGDLKRLLGKEKVCYYKKEPNGQLKLHCF